jgi:Xaa-Pro aminopeptidase
MNTKEKITRLRTWMSERGLSAYIVPSTDPHQDEYVPAHWRRRAWMSGFTGSAGDLVVTQKEAGLWTDGRYFLQAAAQLKGSGIQLRKMGEPGVPAIPAYLAATLNDGESFGFDPQLISHDAYKKLAKELGSAGVRMTAVEENPVDLIWNDRPSAAPDPVVVHPDRFAGETVTSKLRRLRKAMKDKKAAAHVLSNLDGIAWLYNIRGRDIDYNPMVISYAIVTESDATLFVTEAKVPLAARKKLEKNVRIRPYEEIGDALLELGGRKARVWIDGTMNSQWVADRLEGATLIDERSPVTTMKAKKNDVEIQGMWDAHVQDGVAMVRFFRWLEDAVPRGGVTEISASDRLAEFRAEGKNFQGLSFDSISGYAGHGAIIHYSSTDKTNVPLLPDGIYLIDSGGQYSGGTTDITRTVLLGKKATKEQKDRFTRVLQGHIALAMLRFPAGTRGMQIDVMARLPLWAAGLNYNHGTGHGVGAYLSVHEGPQSITPSRDTGAALEPGNILSNEPGYYLADQYGIRTENLILVVEAPEHSKAGIPFLGFETITVCPIDTALVDAGMLKPAERKWLNDYHKRVHAELSPHLDAADRAWLKRACALI